MITPDRSRKSLPPLQERSRATMERIIAAADQLLDGRSFSEISTDEIINAAGVSRSSFYARFPSKESLLPALFEFHLTQARDALSAVAELDLTDVSGEVLVDLLVGSYLDFFRKFQAPIATFDMSSVSGIAQLRSEAIHLAADLYVECVGESGNEAFRSRVEFACRAVGAILVRALAPPAGFAVALGFSDERLRKETVMMVTLYLDAARDDGPQSNRDPSSDTTSLDEVAEG